MKQVTSQVPHTRTANTKPIIVSNRTDGLGERLCAMMNAIRLADALDTDFRFHWTSDIWNPVYHQLATDKDKQILGQSVASQEEIFAVSFIKDYALTQHNPQKYRPCPPKPMTLAKFKAAEVDGAIAGWVPNQNFLENTWDKSFLQKVKTSSKDAFGRIAFCPPIEALVQSAQNERLPRFDAIHLRSGDMVFGEVRKWGQWSNKVLNPSVAIDLIRTIKKKGRQVILFGQDVDGLKALSHELDCLFVGDMIPATATTPTQRALYEIVLMSRAQNIYAGYSGFSRAACMIGNTRAKLPSQLYSIENYLDVTLTDLGNNSDKYHPLVSAYSYWQAYDLGAQYLNLPQQYEIITCAAKHDPDNLLFAVLQVALLYRMGQDILAEDLIKKQMARRPDGDFIAQLTFKYYSTDYTHKAQFNDYHGAARRPGNQNAKRCSDAIKRALKK